MHTIETLNNLALQHYENFPVGSFLLPKKYRNTLHLIYSFARVGDDIADELEISPKEKIDLLNEWMKNLIVANENKSENKYFINLAKIITEFKIPINYFQDLIDAFIMDANHSQPKTNDDLFYYCTKSANPVGRIYLTLIGKQSEINYKLSDYFCTALQLTNFIQDLSIDRKRNRFYIPLSEENGILYNHSETINTLEVEKIKIINNQVELTNQMFKQSKYLIHNLNYPFNLELALIWNGGMRVLEKIKQIEYKTHLSRPKLYWYDKVLIFFRAIKSLIWKH